MSDHALLNLLLLCLFCFVWFSMYQSTTMAMSGRSVHPKGGTLIFSSYVGLGPAATVYKKYQEYQAPENYLKFLQSKKIYFFLYKHDLAVNQYLVHILSLVTDNNPS